MARSTPIDKVAVTEPSKLVREFLVPSSPAAAEVARIITGSERAQYTDTVGSAVHVVQLLDAFGEATATVLSLPGRADIGAITFFPRSCYGHGPQVRRCDNDRGISQADRRTIAEFCESLQVRKGGAR
jgi:hypothetical protein